MNSASFLNRHRRARVRFTPKAGDPWMPVTSTGMTEESFDRLTGIIPILAGAPADHATRSKWLERLFEAVQNDGVEYLGPAEERWGEIAHYPDLINKYADRLIEMVRRAWSDHQSFQYVTGTSICLSCLLEAGRYDFRSCSDTTDKVLVLAPVRSRGVGPPRLWEGAIAFAEGMRDTSNSRFEDNSIELFCEDLLIQHGRTDEAYRKYLFYARDDQSRESNRALEQDELSESV